MKTTMIVAAGLVASALPLLPPARAWAEPPPPAAATEAAPPARSADGGAAPRLPVRLAFQTEAAFGELTGSFHNQLVGARVDLQFSPRVSCGGYLGYASLKGKDGRASNVLPYAQVEYALPLGGDGARVRVPLRFASGYLPHNGPVVRMAAGLAVALGPKVDLVTELLAPMFWVTNDQMLLSMNLALELAIKL